MSMACSNIAWFRAALGWLLALTLMVGCATRIDWNARIGTYTYDDAVKELGFKPKELPPRDRERYWYVAISKAHLDSADAGGHDPDSTKYVVHPRAYGTYPRILGRYVREQKLLTLEDAVRKMSGGVATRLGMRDRGFLREGMFADVVVFDDQTIMDVATPENPHRISRGVEQVFVNGVQVVRDGTHTGATPGRALRGPGY